MEHRAGAWLFAAALLALPFPGFAAQSAKAIKPPAVADAPAALTRADYVVETIVKPSSMHGVFGLAFGPDGGLYAASLTGYAIYRIDIATGAVTSFLGPPRASADDLAFAPDGTIAWTGAAQAAVFARGKDGKVRTLAQDVPGVNGINFTKDGRLFFSRIGSGEGVNDGLYEADPSGVKPVRVVAEGIGGLNAFQIAADNNLYGPLIFRGKVVKINVDTGEASDVASGFETPSAVRIEADGHLIVLDYFTGDVIRVDPKTGDKTHLVTLPPPVDNLAIAKDGTLYVSSTAFNGVTAIDPKTLATRRITWGQLTTPGLLSVMDTGEAQQLLVADMWGPRLVDPASGEATLIKRGPGVSGATAIAVNGSTYILSSIGIGGGGVVQVVERATGRLLANMPNFGAPYDVKPIADGFVVADYAVGRLTKVGNDPAHTRTTLAWDFDGPVGLADAGNGVFYVSEYSGGRVSRVNTKTNAQDVVIDGLDEPEGIALAPDGRLIVAEVGEKRVLAVDPNDGRAQILADHLGIGLTVGPQVPAPFLPTGVAVAKDGTIYVTGDIDNTIYRLTPPRQ